MGKISDEELVQYEQLKNEYDVVFNVKATFIALYGQKDEDAQIIEELYLKQVKAYNALKSCKKKLFDKYLKLDCVYVDNNCYVDTINARVMYRVSKGDVVSSE